jgi:hypothetical protein
LRRYAFLHQKRKLPSSSYARLKRGCAAARLRAAIEEQQEKQQ